MTGHVTIAGAGPGDPGLITVGASRALAEADVVVFDALANRALLRGAKSGALLIDAGKRSGAHTLSQREIEALLVEHARDGKRVVRLKGGDPFIFGRGGEEALACARAGVRFTVIPGVTSAIAAPAYAGIPLTHRGIARNFVVMTGEVGDSAATDWAAAAAADTVVVLMGAATLGANMAALMAAGKPGTTPVACIQWGTHARQRVVTGEIETIAARSVDAGMGSPMVTVVGEVVQLAAEIAWHFSGPLAGRRIVVTRAREQASELATMLESLGAEVIEAPLIRATMMAPNPPLTTAIDSLSKGSWMVVASARGVEALFSCLASLGHDARALAGIRLAAVGTATAAALLRGGIIADFVPSRATGECLASELPLNGEKVLVIGSTLSGPELARQLGARGAAVIDVAGYETRQETLDDTALEHVLAADAITFTSSSTVASLHEALKGHPVGLGTKLLSIGPKTSATMRELLGRVDREAREATVASLAAATLEALRWE